MRLRDEDTATLIDAQRHRIRQRRLRRPQVHLHALGWLDVLEHIRGFLRGGGNLRLRETFGGLQTAFGIRGADGLVVDGDGGQRQGEEEDERT